MMEKMEIIQICGVVKQTLH